MNQTETLLQHTRSVKERVQKRLFSCIIFCFCTALAPALLAQARPTINSFTPTNGPVGATITITGENFGSAPAQNVVYFGAAKANVISANTSAVTVQVPAGATLAPISVTANNLTGASSRDFKVTFAADPVTSGSFGTAKDLTTPGAQFYASLFADLNGDGKLDIISVQPQLDRGLAVRKNISIPGTISYDDTKIFKTTVNGTPALADLNSDGKLDLLLFPQFLSNFHAIKNISEPDSIAFELNKVVSVPGISYISTIGDIDNDGRPDLLAANDSVLLFTKNTSTGADISFGTTISVPLLPNIPETDNYIRNLWIKDLDGDGRQDIIAATSGSTYAVRNTSTGGNVSFAPPLKLNEVFGRTDPGTLLAIGDLDDDGKPDLIINNTLLNRNEFLQNKSTPGSLSFAAAQPFAPPSGYRLGLYPVSGSERLDFINTDGTTVVDPDGNPTAVSFYVNLYPQHHEVINGKDTFSYPEKVRIYAGNTYKSFDFKDLDGDGRPDLILYDAVAYLANANPMVLKNQSGVAPAPPVITAVTPDSIYVNDTIWIHGKNFTGVNVVRFGDTQVKTFSILSDSLISAVVLYAPGDLIIQSSAGNDTFPPIKINYDPYIKTKPADIPIACYPASMTFTVEIPAFYQSDEYYYAWFRNGVRVGDRNKPYSPRIFEVGDSVWSVLIRKRQTAVIAKSNVVHITKIMNFYHPTIYIKSNKASYCEGDTAIFKASVVKPGKNPKFLWMKNDILVGDSSDTYKDAYIQNADVVYCILYEPEGPCVPEYLRSQPLTITVVSNKPAAITSITGPSVVTAGQQVTFSVPAEATSTFRWPIPADASIVSGNGTNAIVVNWGNSAGKISVKATNACGSSAVVTKLVTLASNSNASARIAGNADEVNTGKTALVVYPNPATSQTTISFTAPTTGKYTMFITDAQGRTLQTHQLELQKGSVAKKISTASYAPGIYHVTITDNKQIISKQLMISR